MRIQNLLLFSLLAIVISSCSLSARISKGDKKYALGEYYVAGNTYRRVYPTIPIKNRTLRAEVAFKMGNSYRHINENKRAETAYKNAIRYKYKDDFVYFYAAEVARKNGKHKDAAKLYETFLATNPTHKEAQNGLTSSNLVLSEWKNTTRYVVKKEDHFNSRYSDFSPAFANSRGDLLFFNSTRKVSKKNKQSNITGENNNNIYSVRKNIQGEWEEPFFVEDGINTEFDEGVCSFSANGQELFFTRSKTEKGKILGTAIFVSKRSGGTWAIPQQIILLQDSSLNLSHPTLSPNGEELYFVSDMKGGLGEKDIWKVERTPDGWGIPINAGETINTGGNEMFPFFRKNGTLYFASDGHPGFGGLDIFKAELLENTEWKVSNMMSPINSEGDDFSITLLDKEEKGFFSSNRGDRRFRDHIWSVELPELAYRIEGTVSDTKGETLSDATIRIVGTDGSIDKIAIRRNGTFSHTIAPNTKYILLASSRGFLNRSEQLSTEKLDNSKTFTLNIQLASISRPVQMNNIFFTFGSADLTPASSAALDDLVKLLTDNPTVTLEIAAHTDMIGLEATNLQLSTQRAQSVIEYLKKKGVDKQRLTPKGYGKSVPVIVDKALAKKHSFLQEDRVLSEDFVKTLTPEQQEIANQINRRTEFKVIKTSYQLQ
ncbi:MAG: OmpA family protein [Paludibacteraceae bacterium]|nr:OmpA family protein [Paludibacteraceae bacterium]